MTDKKIHNVFLILLVSSILCVTITYADASPVDTTYPGGSGEIMIHTQGIINTSTDSIQIINISNYSYIFGSNQFYSPEYARFFLSQIKYWKVEAPPHLNVSEPDITIVNHYTNTVYQYSNLKVKVPFYVHKDAPVGDYRFTLTFFDEKGSPLLNVTGTVLVCSSEMSAKLTGLGRKLGFALLIIIFLIVCVWAYNKISS